MSSSHCHWCFSIHAQARYGHVTDSECSCTLQVHKFSKFIHGTATLLPELVQAFLDDDLEATRTERMATTA